MAWKRLIWCSFVFWKMVLRLVLVEADAGEYERHRHELAVEDPHARRTPRQSRYREREERERQVEREHVDRRRMQVHAPLDGEPDPDEVERERPRCDAELTRSLVPVEQLPEQRAGGAERDRIERHEELVPEEAHAERDESEREVRDEPRLAPEEPGEERAEHDRPADRRARARCIRRRKGRCEQNRPDSGVTEPGDPVSPRPGEEKDG